MTNLTKLGSTLKVDDGVKISYLPYGTWRMSFEEATDEVTIYSVDTKSIVFDDSITLLTNVATGLVFTEDTLETFISSFSGGGDFERHLRERVIVQSPQDLQNIDSSKFYFIDGVVDFTGSGLNIDVSTNALYIGGYGAGSSRLICTDDNYTLFVGGKDIAGGDTSIEISGVNSKVFGLVADTGLEAIEFTNLNYENCTSLGFIDGYRQGLEENTARFEGQPTLELRGTWLGGFRITTSIVRNVDPATNTLFKAGTGLVFNSRFKTDANIDLPAGTCSLLDFSPANFANSNTLQLKDMILTRNEVSNSKDVNLTPNITSDDIESDWAGNDGLDSTIRRASNAITAEVVTTFANPNEYTTLLGTRTYGDMVHFTAVPTGIRLDGSQSRWVEVNGFYSIAGSKDNQIDLQYVIQRFGGGEEVVSHRPSTINNLSGPRDVAMLVINATFELTPGDIFLTEQVENKSGTDAVTAETSSYLNLKVI